MSFNRYKIGEILVNNGSLTPSQHMYVMDKLPGEGGVRFGEICLREGLISEIALAQALAEQFGLEYVDLQGFKLDESVLNSIPSDAIYRYHFIPLEQDNESLTVAVADPTDVLKLDEMELLLGPLASYESRDRNGDRSSS